MFIEIHGAGFENKGAELMLRTTIEELSKRVKNFVPAIDPFYGSYEQRSSLGIHQVIPSRYHVGTKGFEKRLINQFTFAFFCREKIFQFLTAVPTNKYGLVSISRIMALVDIAGFAYTDEWGTKPAADMALLASRFKRTEKPVILMPQAFGPFYRDDTKKAFKKIINNVTMIFARDEQSYQNIMVLSPEAKNIYLAPDITLFYPDVPDKIRTPSEGKYVCVIPNIRMLDQGKEAWGDKYKLYLVYVIRLVIAQGVQVCIIVHDASGDDLKLAKEIYTEVSSPLAQIVQENDPLNLKKIIADSIMVVGSRYHSLVTAFSKFIPGIALGWSHKYDMLYRDFNMEKFIIAPETSLALLQSRVKELMDLQLNEAYRIQIQNSLKEMQKVNIAMWDRVALALNAC